MKKLTDKTIPGKRRLLYEMLLKLSGIEKRVTLSFEELNRKISELRQIYLPFHSEIADFLKTLMNKIKQSLQENLKIEKITSIELLESISRELREIQLEEGELKEEWDKILSNLVRQVHLLKGEESVKDVAKQNIDELLQYLLVTFNRIDKKLRRLQRGDIDQGDEKGRILQKINDIKHQIFNERLREEDIEDLLLLIKDLHRELKYQPASFSFALISRAYKTGRISFRKLTLLLKTKVYNELVRGAMIWGLNIFGAMPLERLGEILNINSSELLRNAVSLLDRKAIMVKEFENEYYFDVVKEYPQLYRLLIKQIQILKKNIDKFSSFSKTMSNAIFSIADGIFDKLIQLGNKSDQIYMEEVETLNELITKINEVMSRSDSIQSKKAMQINIKALLELYQMFRVKMVYEKEPYLIERSSAEQKQKQLENFITNAIRKDFEKGLIIALLKEKGPLNILDLARLSGLLKRNIVQHVLKLVKDKVLIIKGTKDGYYLYDVPRSLSQLEQKFSKIMRALNRLLQTYTHLPRVEELDVEQIILLSSHLKVMKENCSMLQKEGVNSELNEIIESQLNSLNSLLDHCNQLTEKIPQTKSKFDLTKLVLMPLPRVNEEYADLIAPQYLVGFGTIEWDMNKCLSCASCQYICPEMAVTLVNEWDLPNIFTLEDEQLNNLPENRKLLIQLIKTLAIKKPTKSIKLPENTLGFGRIYYNPLTCIACRKCEERCPSDALKFEEKWNFPEIMKFILKEG
ncbi:MAG: 4Fe-4S binding protein [Candidatus Helarchaeota archaeon]